MIPSRSSYTWRTWLVGIRCPVVKGCNVIVSWGAACDAANVGNPTIKEQAIVSMALFKRYLMAMLFFMACLFCSAGFSQKYSYKLRFLPYFSRFILPDSEHFLYARCISIRTIRRQMYDFSQKKTKKSPLSAILFVILHGLTKKIQDFSFLPYL